MHISRFSILAFFYDWILMDFIHINRTVHIAESGTLYILSKYLLTEWMKHYNIIVNYN